MPVFRVEHNANYTTMSNVHLKDKTLSFRAKGLLSQMLSLPDDWDYSMAGLIAISKEEYKGVKSALDELKEHGYVTVTKLYPKENERPRIEYVYCVYETPHQDTKNQPLPTVAVEEVALQEVTLPLGSQLNTNIQNTKNKDYSEKPIFENKRLQEAFDGWIEYKNEKRQSYKERGLQSLITTILKNVKQYGVDNVIDIMNESMANNWQGIAWDRLERKPIKDRYDSNGEKEYF